MSFLKIYFVCIFLEVLKSSIGATEDIISVNSIRNKELWSPMLCCREFFNDSVKSIPTTPNLQVKIKYTITIKQYSVITSKKFTRPTTKLQFSTIMKIHPLKLLLRLHQKPLQLG